MVAKKTKKYNDEKTEQARLNNKNTTPVKNDDEYEVIGWIEPVKNKEGVENQKVARVKIYTGEYDENDFPIALTGIVLLDSVEKFMNREIQAIPIKTKPMTKEN